MQEPGFDSGTPATPDCKELMEARRQLIEAANGMDSPEAAGLSLREADRLGRTLNGLR